MRKALFAMAIAAIAATGCNSKHKVHEKHSVRIYHLKDKRFCYKDKKTNKWYWLEKLADADLDFVPESDYYYSPTAIPSQFPSGYGWVAARGSNLPAQPEIEEIEEIEQNEPANMQDEEMGVNEEGDPADAGDADGGASEGGSDAGGDSGGGDGGGGDGGGGDGGGD